MLFKTFFKKIKKKNKNKKKTTILDHIGISTFEELYP